MDNENRNDYAGLINQLKLTMFNIIAAEESKLSGLVSYLNSQPQVDNGQLLEMYNKQRNAVSSLTIITNDLGSILGQLDYNDSIINDILSNNNQDVSQVDSEMTAQEVAFDDNVNDDEATDSSIVEETMETADTSEVEETVSDGFVETPTDPEPVQESPVESIVESRIENSTDETSVESPTDEVESVVEEVASDTDSVSSENPDVIVETADAPIAETSTSEETPAEEIKEEASETQEDTVTDNADEKTETIAEEKNEDKTTEVISENSETLVEEKVESTDDSADKVVETKEEIKDGDPVVVEAPVVNKSSDVITEELDSSNDAVAEEKPSENVIQIKAESLDGSDDVSDTPIASLSDEKVDESSETIINFVAINPNFSRAILINKKQSGNLRRSLLQQTELFNSFTVKNKGSNDVKVTADNLEEMLEKATALYSQEKVEEAEALMQKIDEFRSTQSVATR